MTFAQLKQDISKLTRTVSTILKSIDASAADVCDLKSICTDTNAKVKSINMNSSELTKNVTTKLNEFSKSNTLLSHEPPKTPSNPSSFANIMKQQHFENRQTNTSKRKIDDSGSTKPVSTKPTNIPAAKMGKKIGSVGLAVAPAPVKTIRKPKQSNEQDSIAPVFDFSLHVSRIATSVTVDDMNGFISSESPLIPNIDFKCTRLLKKDQSVESLSFISFKIDFIETKCPMLLDEEFWPSGAMIRPFIPSRTLGDFLTTSPGTTKSQPSKIQKTISQKNNNVSSASDLPINNSDLHLNVDKNTIDLTNTLEQMET